jgi:hypothetical protein
LQRLRRNTQNLTQQLRTFENLIGVGTTGLPMQAEEFEVMRRQMVAEISAHAVQLRETIGKSAFAGQVMAAMEKVPRLTLSKQWRVTNERRMN